MKKLFKLLSLSLFALIIQSLSLTAQISDAQLLERVRSFRSSGYSTEQVISELQSKGISRAQLERVISQLDITNRQESGGSSAINRARTQSGVTQQQDIKAVNEEDMLQNEQSEQSEKAAALSRVFGMELFLSGNNTFEPNLNLPTPQNYQLGAGDEIIIDIWGYSELTIRQKISPEGNINLPGTGPIFLSGLQINEAAAKIKRSLSKIYSNLSSSNPGTFLNLTLGAIRSIKVNVIGEVRRQGSYTLSSFATVFHALYAAGGVNGIGTLREIKIYRGGSLISEVDLYDYLFRGDNSKDINLRDGDIVLTGPYKRRVQIEGSVKRPMIYELKDNETLESLIELSGGFLSSAYKKSIRLSRKGDTNFKIYTVESADYNGFTLKDGDSVTVDNILDKYENRVVAEGALYRPGEFAIAAAGPAAPAGSAAAAAAGSAAIATGSAAAATGSAAAAPASAAAASAAAAPASAAAGIRTLRDLIAAAEGITGDAFPERALLYRENKDLTTTVESVNLIKLLSGELPDIELRKSDRLYVPNRNELRDELYVTLDGEVKRAGRYPYAHNMSIEDLILQGGGFAESASRARIDVSRRVKNPMSVTQSSVRSENFSFSLENGLIIMGDKKFVLEPYDIVEVRRSPGYEVQQIVSLTGEVLFGGSYPKIVADERISSFIKRAGGVTSSAYLKGAKLVRMKTQSEIDMEESALRLSGIYGNDSIASGSLNIGTDYNIGIDLERALKEPGGEFDIVLKDGDKIDIPEINNVVRVSGGVMYPNSVTYSRSLSVRDYINSAGGYAFRAKKNRVYVVYMNNEVSKGLNSKIEPGCEIIVPVKPEGRSTSITEIIGITTSLASMAALIISILR